ncbi:MAG: hypothetical protein EOO92_13340 [Pedobacter sp.]|nr:MAG: hypothetical protein EOO92_13340 [Pedobacter sp.]
MKRFLAMFAMFYCLTALSANAQRGTSLGIGFDFAFPQDNFGNGAELGVGPSLLFQSPLQQNLNFTVNIGYLRFNGDSPFANIKYREGFIPIKAGLRYFISEAIYGSGEAGLSISTADGSGSGVSFLYAPTVGAQIPAGNGAIDLGIRYEGWVKSGTRSLVGLRVGYNF